jgi:Ca-activated chloride channel family protein
MVEISGQDVVYSVLAAFLAAVLTAAAEFLHWRRIKRLNILAFGPGGRPATWVYLVSPLRVLATGALAWSLMTLMFLSPRTQTPGGNKPISFEKLKHIVLVLDVSPSMRLQDAGVEGAQSRMVRAREVMESYFRRIPMNEYRVTVLATYTKSLPVVEDTKDPAVVENVLNDLPMHFAFVPGETNLFSGIQGAVDVARGWRPRSTTVVLVSDGDTVPSTGMPRMPPSVADVLVVGVGDPVNGSFLNGRNSRQDVSTLRQIAVRLKGVYHNGNDRHLPTELVRRLTTSANSEEAFSWGVREWALAILVLSALLLNLIPVILHYSGTAWQPGIRFTRRVPRAAMDNGPRRQQNEAHTVRLSDKVQH